MSILLIYCFCLGCSNPRLVVQTEYLTRESRASYYVQSPDPLLEHPPIGQRLILNWFVPKKYLDQEDLQLVLTLRFRNREEIKVGQPITKECGIFIYDLINERFCTRKGILTYKVDLQSQDGVIAEWRHQLWTELIIFDEFEHQDENYSSLNINVPPI